MSDTPPRLPPVTYLKPPPETPEALETAAAQAFHSWSADDRLASWTKSVLQFEAYKAGFLAGYRHQRGT